MAIHLRQNQYRGVNAHLHSALQNESGGWKVFHSAHINDLARAIDGQLPLGYEVKPAKSLQLKEYHPDTGLPIKPPDTGETRKDDEAYLTAILISKIGESGERKSLPISNFSHRIVNLPLKLPSITVSNGERLYEKMYHSSK